MIKSPLWSPLMTEHDATATTSEHDPHLQVLAVASRNAVHGGRWITRLPASGLKVRLLRGTPIPQATALPASGGSSQP